MVKIPFSDIAHGVMRSTAVDSTWTAETGLVVLGDPKAKIGISLIDEITAILEGSLEAKVSSECSRCGDSLAFEVDERFRYIFRLGSDNAHHEKEVEISDEDSLTVYLEEPEVDIHEVLREQLILSVPEKLLCRKECKGLCQHCGVLLDKEKCECTDQNLNSPFAVLNKLKNK